MWCRFVVPHEDLSRLRRVRAYPGRLAGGRADDGGKEVGVLARSLAISPSPSETERESFFPSVSFLPPQPPFARRQAAWLEQWHSIIIIARSGKNVEKLCYDSTILIDISLIII